MIRSVGSLIWSLFLEQSVGDALVVEDCLAVCLGGEGYIHRRVVPLRIVCLGVQDFGRESCGLPLCWQRSFRRRLTNIDVITISVGV